MDFNFSDEQQQLRETLLGFIKRAYGFAKRREILESPAGFSREVWRQLADLGVLSVGIPEAHGGGGGGAVDILAVMEVLGRGLVVEPYLPTVVIGAGLVVRAGSEAQQQRLLPGVVAGEQLLALAHDEPGSRYELGHVTARARAEGDVHVLDGHKTVVLGGAEADTLIVSARTQGAAGDRDGITLFLVDANARGVARLGYRNHDGQRACEVTLEAVRVAADAILGRAGAGLALVEEAVDHALAALCAEALGIMTALLQVTADYVKTRRQFGVPIGSFQVIQHRMADMLMRVEQARSMAYLAAATVDQGDADALARRRVLSAAKALVGQAARFVGQQAVQLHGGIGVTDDAMVSHYFKRLTTIDLTFGDADHHLARFSDLRS